MRLILKNLRPAFTMLFFMSVMCGIGYPIFVTLVSGTLFPAKAGGSILYMNGKPVGSELIGQPFTDPGYFRGRPSSTLPGPYNAASSGASNFGPLNPALLERVRRSVIELRASESPGDSMIPVDLVTSSASGLDPHISIASAHIQIPRIARERNLTVEEILTLVERNTEERQWGIFGEPRVNVLKLNLDLNDFTSKRRSK